MTLYSLHGKRLSKRQEKGKIDLIFSIAFFAFVVLFMFSSAMMIRYYRQSGREERAFTTLAANVAEVSQQDRATKPLEERSTAVEEAPQYTEYLPLYEQNSDFAGWLHIDGTQIDYPVMCTPDEPEYYLRRAFDGSSSISGTPFIGENGTVDSDMFIVYGHNMKNGTMFGTLHGYSTKAFWADNPSINFSTITEHREYEVFAAVKTRVLFQGEIGYRYYDHAGSLDEAAFEELIQWLIENSLYNTGIIPEYGEQIVILSTCSYHEDNGRFLVAARQHDHVATSLPE